MSDLVVARNCCMARMLPREVLFKSISTDCYIKHTFIVYPDQYSVHLKLFNIVVRSATHQTKKRR